MAYTTIDKPSDYFNTVLYSGNGTAIGSGGQAITGVGFAPDWTWIKERSSTSPHKLLDTVRGATKELESSATSAEATTAESLASFDSDGFTVGSNGAVNENSQTYASWNWLAGGTASSNSNGSITSSVSASTTAGFSIVSYTGTGANATVGHGLGAAPAMIIQKNRIDAQPWWVYHSSIGAGGQLRLSGTDAEGSDGGVLWNSTAPTSTVFSLGDNGGSNGSSDACIAYCFAEKKGYSKVGGYTGNGNADGPFIYTGFRPAWLMMKRTDSAGEWLIYDNKRDPFNLRDTRLEAQDNFADSTGTTKVFDFVSNGFKCRGSDTDINASSGTYIYMAFAEAPFVSSSGVPTTAR